MIDSPLARFSPFLAFARNNLSRARARTILAMAGITIGVVAIASLGMFGATLEQSFMGTADDAIRTVGVGPGEDSEFGLLRREQVAEIERYAGNGDVYTLSRGRARVTGLQQTTSASLVSVSDPEVFVTAESGQIPRNWRSGVAIGNELAETLGVQPGDSVQVDGESRRVVAVLAESSRASFVSTGDAVVLPPGELGDGASQVLIRAETPQQAFAISDRIDENLNSERRSRYSVFDAESALERFNQQIGLIRTFLLAVGGISLLVASVSILNVMLMSTIERKEEIGVLRAVGYHRLDIVKLMLYEAALLGVVGSIFGVFISIGLGMVMNAQLLSDPLAFSGQALQYTVLGFLFGTGASFLSGLYPAWKAANARPVEALRD
ncbi:ABC transporter permease [Halomicrobium sp. IBSBa]|uniref:ABC transporter permease n=1 Tax=Halomicrobium sp. IBSBa TaxID=2778916 RepID=UPI001ABFE00A|nr:ABC transporter permease [Halomicrobium sp. IBSBa]MBO4249329.1 ABC transporter permease [Halomicrobium sp. IBSBa]